MKEESRGRKGGSGEMKQGEKKERKEAEDGRKPREQERGRD